MIKIISTLKSILAHKIWRLVLILVVCQSLVLIAVHLNNKKEDAAVQAQVEYEYTQVTRGDINLTASGSGRLAVAKQYDLAFSTTGSLDLLFVQLGDQVTAGETLAVSSEVETLQKQVLESEQLLEDTRDAMVTYLAQADHRIAQALLDRATAQENYQEAEKNLRQFGVERCTEELTNSYYNTYLSYVPEVELWENELNDPDTPYGMDFILEHLNPLEANLNKAYLNYQYCQGYTSEEVASSQADFQLAQSNLDKAESAYESMLANEGIDQTEVDILQAKVKNQEYQLVKAQDDLDGATLKAPVDGTILAIQANVGDSIGTSTVISMADLSQMIVNVNVDELDFKALQVGCDSQVVFTAIKERTFSGEVAQVSPKTTSGNNSQTIKGIILLQDAYLMPGRYLAPNMDGTVSLSCGQASQVLLVPATSVYQNNGQYFVYVLNENNEPEKTLIEIGLQSGSYYEVVSGLQEGEIIITSQISD
jgi:RND family efflux transporter MFP subunit